MYKKRRLREKNSLEKFKINYKQNERHIISQLFLMAYSFR